MLMMIIKISQEHVRLKSDYVRVSLVTGFHAHELIGCHAHLSRDNACPRATMTLSNQPTMTSVRLKSCHAHELNGCHAHLSRANACPRAKLHVI